MKEWLYVKVEVSWARVLGGAEGGHAHRALERWARGGQCLEGLRAVPQEGGVGPGCAALPQGWFAQLAGRGNTNTGESTGFGKDSHPMVFKTLFKST